MNSIERHGRMARSARTTTRRCVLCDRIVADDDYIRFTATFEALELLGRTFRTFDPDEGFDENVPCKSCNDLPDKERKKLAAKAMQRDLRRLRSEN